MRSYGFIHIAKAAPAVVFFVMNSSPPPTCAAHSWLWVTLQSPTVGGECSVFSDKTLIAVVQKPHRLYKQLEEPSDDGVFRCFTYTLLGFHQWLL